MPQRALPPGGVAGSREARQWKEDREGGHRSARAHLMPVTWSALFWCGLPFGAPIGAAPPGAAGPMLGSIFCRAPLFKNFS